LIASCLLLAVQVTHANENLRLKEVNEKIENFVAENTLTEALNLCNILLAQTKSAAETRFLTMNKMRLIVKLNTDLDSIPILFNQASQIKSSNDSIGCFTSARLLEIYGHYFYKKKDIQTALHYLQKADTVYQGCKNLEYRIYNLNMMGNIHRSIQNDKEALYNLLLANLLLNDSAQVSEDVKASVFNDLGVIYLDLNLYEKAIEYFKNIEIDKQSTLRQAHAYNNLGVCYLHLNYYALATKYLRLASQNYLLINRKLDYARALNNLGSAIEEANPDSALYYYREAINIRLNIGDSTTVVSPMLNICNLFYKQNKLPYCLKAITTLQHFKSFFDDNDWASYHQINSYYFKSTGNYKQAYEHQVMYHAYTDTISLKRNALQLIRTETEFNLNQQKIKITNLEKEQKIAELHAKQHNTRVQILSITTGFIVFFLLGLIFYFYRKQEFQKNLRLSEVQLTSYASLLQGQEGERARLAKELHDSVGNNLSFIKSETLRHAPDNVYLLSLISQTAEDVRSITHNLMPSVIRKFGLKEGLKDLVNKWQQTTSILVDLNIASSFQRYDENLELAIFRIIQELTNNAIKHGESDYILIELSETNDGILLNFEDNGSGFDTQSASVEGGLGMQNINNRVVFLNGTMQVSSSGAGSKFKFIFNIKPL